MDDEAHATQRRRCTQRSSRVTYEKTVEKTMRARKKGTLKSGRSGRKVKSRKQAIAIALSEARKSGAKVPKKKKGGAKKKGGKKKASNKRGTRKRKSS